MGTLKSAVTIAGSDSSGGAGIQADIKSMMAQGVFAQSVITALTAQNTLGVRDVLGVPCDFVGKQIDTVFEDIRPDAVKIGMISDPEVARVVAERLRANNAQKIVLDPVMVATSGAALSSDSSVVAVVDDLFCIADVVTPNLSEAEALVRLAVERGLATWEGDVSLSTEEDMAHAARAIRCLGAHAVLVKGGHLSGDAVDLLLLKDGSIRRLSSVRIDTHNTHGTGCTLSSAIAANLAKGMDLEEAVGAAKKYLTGALAHDPGLGQGNGPLNHGWAFLGKRP